MIHWMSHFFLLSQCIGRVRSSPQLANVLRYSCTTDRPFVSERRENALHDVLLLGWLYVRL
jgi:hypothetical protein